jgi:hypothetical protein
MSPADKAIMKAMKKAAATPLNLTNVSRRRKPATSTQLERGSNTTTTQVNHDYTAALDAAAALHRTYDDNYFNFNNRSSSMANVAFTRTSEQTNSWPSPFPLNSQKQNRIGNFNTFPAVPSLIQTFNQASSTSTSVNSAMDYTTGNGTNYINPYPAVSSLIQLSNPHRAASTSTAATNASPYRDGNELMDYFNNQMLATSTSTTSRQDANISSYSLASTSNTLNFNNYTQARTSNYGVQGPFHIPQQYGWNGPAFSAATSNNYPVNSLSSATNPSTFTPNWNLEGSTTSNENRSIDLPMQNPIKSETEEERGPILTPIPNSPEQAPVPPQTEEESTITVKTEIKSETDKWDYNNK